MKSILLTILAVFMVLVYAVVIYRCGYKDGCSDGVKYGVRAVRLEAVSRGYGHFEVQKYQEDEYGLTPSTFEWNKQEVKEKGK